METNTGRPKLVLLSNELSPSYEMDKWRVVGPRVVGLANDPIGIDVPLEDGRTLFVSGTFIESVNELWLAQEANDDDA